MRFVLSFLSFASIHALLYIRYFSRVSVGSFSFTRYFFYQFPKIATHCC